MGESVESNLTTGEQVVYEAKLHWMVFVTLRAFFTLWIALIIDMMTSEFAIANKRIIIKVGLISRRTLEMNLAKIESVNVNQGILGRILDYGTLTVIGTDGTRESFRGISQPWSSVRHFNSLNSNQGDGLG